MTTEITESLSQFILSVSGWRKVFDVEGEQGARGKISAADAFLTAVACRCFQKFLYACGEKDILIATDTRPTGEVLQEIAVHSFTELHCRIVGIASAPEIMAHAKKSETPFIYFSASHNPIGHNGIKFGLKNGGVLDAEKSEKLIRYFRGSIALLTDGLQSDTSESILGFDNIHVVPYDSKAEMQKFQEAFFAYWQKRDIGSTTQRNTAEKESALKNYFDFALETMSGAEKPAKITQAAEQLKAAVSNYKKKYGNFCLAVDFNGSARVHSIDKKLFNYFGIPLKTVNEKKIVHGIIPEGANLATCEALLKDLHNAGENPLFALMPDCDGDRGNLVFWNDREEKPFVLNAQQVFALCVLSELAYIRSFSVTNKPLAVAVNCATSMRIDAIANLFSAKVFRAEVGEANVVNLARKLRDEGYCVRILGEGSNGGNITHPASVRDPLNTMFSILKLFLFRNYYNMENISYADDSGLTAVPSSCLHTKAITPWELWQSLLNSKIIKNFSLMDIIDSLPQYTTTETQADRAILHIRYTDAAALKRNYQTIFLREWQEQKERLRLQYGFNHYEVRGTVGVDEFDCSADFGASQTGGLKIIFYSAQNKPVAFIWMRGSKTEPLFRIMADVTGNNEAEEKDLVHWQAKMLLEASKGFDR